MIYISDDEEIVDLTNDSNSGPESSDGCMDLTNDSNSAPKSSDDVKIKQELLQVTEGGKLPNMPKWSDIRRNKWLQRQLTRKRRGQVTQIRIQIQNKRQLQLPR